MSTPAAAPEVRETESNLPSHISPSRLAMLQRWANRLRGRYGVPVYLVGSALREGNPDPRDWDVRLMLPDDDFAARFGPVAEWVDEGNTGRWTRTRFRWSDQCVKDTKGFVKHVHLNGDVQIYAESHAASLYGEMPRVRIDTFETLAAPARPAPQGGADAEATAQQFHEAYERLAPSFGYETRKASAKPWADVPENNRRLMTAVCAEVLATLRAQALASAEDTEKARESITALWRAGHSYADAKAAADADLYAIMWAQRGKSVKIMGVGVAPVWYDTRAGADSLAKAYNDDAGPGMRYTVVAVEVPNVE